jgi:hypothetical protein
MLVQKDADGSWEMQILSTLIHPCLLVKLFCKGKFNKWASTQFEPFAKGLGNEFFHMGSLAVNSRATQSFTTSIGIIRFAGFRTKKEKVISIYLWAMGLIEIHSQKMLLVSS